MMKILMLTTAYTPDRTTILWASGQVFDLTPDNIKTGDSGKVYFVLARAQGQDYGVYQDDKGETWTEWSDKYVSE